MAFTYDLDETGNDLIISKIRLEIGDTIDTAVTADAGVKPDGRNFEDNELLYFYAAEASSVEGGAARACEVLGRMWARQPAQVKVRDYTVSSAGKAKEYRELADTLRRRIGKLTKAGSVAIQPVDAYGDDVTSRDGSSSSGEYTKVLKWP